VGKQIKEMGQNIESKAWLVFKNILYEKKTCILDAQDTILKASKLTLWELKSWGVPNHVQIKCFLNCLKDLDDYYIWNIIVVLHSQSGHVVRNL
jgi:hypothetical protein